MSEEIQVLEKKALDWTAKANAVQIADQLSYDSATELHKGILGVLKEIDGFCDPGIKRWHEGHKGAIADKKRIQGSLPNGEAILRVSIRRWEQEQERIRQEEERRIQEAARKREEEERLRLALEAEAAGASEETVEEIIETPQPIVAPVAALTFQRSEGYSKPRDNWKFKIVDENKIPREYMMPDTVEIGQIVRAMGASCKIAGIEVYNDQSINVRR